MSNITMVPDSCFRGNDNNSIETALLASMMNSGGFGNSNWMWIIFLFFLEPMMRNGWFGNGGYGNGNNCCLGGITNAIDNAGARELFMQAMEHNNADLQNLANMLNTSVDFVKQALCQVQNSISTLSGTVGLTAEQIKNAITSGNMALGSQLSQCCCDIREAVTAGNYQNQITTINQTHTVTDAVRNVGDKVTQGFCDTAYANREQTCHLSQAIQGSTQTIKDATNAQTQAIIAKLDNMERTGLLDKIDAQREVISTLKTNANIVAQNTATQQAIAAAVNPLAAQLAEIKCAQPNTVTVPYYPFTLQPNCGCNNNYNNGCGSCQNQFWY